MTDAPARRSAVAIPGRLFGPYAPLLMYASEAATARGARVHPVEWSVAPPADLAFGAGPGSRAAWVAEQIDPALRAASAAADQPLIIGKSLGSYAAIQAAERGLPAVWLTPLLPDPVVVDALRAATAPYLLIGGTADDLAWRPGLARELTPHVLEVDGADHGMRVRGPLAATAAVLGLVATAVERFLDEVVWPTDARVVWPT
jgi:predicted alpha/beta-hydrolase family hydrolase